MTNQTSDFALRLKRWRKSLGYTQREAADYLGSALQTYQQWEQGRREPVGAARKGIERILIHDATQL